MSILWYCDVTATLQGCDTHERFSRRTVCGNHRDRNCKTFPFKLKRVYIGVKLRFEAGEKNKCLKRSENKRRHYHTKVDLALKEHHLMTPRTDIIQYFLFPEGKQCGGKHEIIFVNDCKRRRRRRRYGAISTVEPPCVT